MVGINESILDFPIPIDFDGRNLLIMNNYLTAKKKFKLKITFVDLETGRSFHVEDKVSGFSKGVLAPGGFAMVHNLKEVLFFDLDTKRQEIASGYSHNSKDAFDQNESIKFIEEKTIPKPITYSTVIIAGYIV